MKARIHWMQIGLIIAIICSQFKQKLKQKNSAFKFKMAELKNTAQYISCFTKQQAGTEPAGPGLA
jgi:hypothetical protein